MTFASYVQNLGVIFIQWLPVCGLMYLAVRLGIQHAVAAIDKKVDTQVDSTLSKIRQA